MAFLDNSGDIILDAVLTDLGRQRMAQGNFRITKFALGDDEINYTLYNKDHPSGSAYYDLEVLQAPVLEAFTATNANINYGLLSYTKTDLLYLPVLKTNEICGARPWTVYTGTGGGPYLFAANQETKTALNNYGPSDVKYSSKSGITSGRKIIIESGFDTTDLTADSATRTSYIVSNNLVDNRFNVYFDNRFIVSIQGPRAAAVFKNSSPDGADDTAIGLVAVAASSTAGIMDNYSVASIRGMPNEVYYDASYTTTDTTVSALSGPRGSATGLAFTVDNGLAAVAGGTTDSKYSLYGETATAITLFGDSDSGYSYTYIDTTVLVQGATTGMQIQLPVRIIRRSA